MGTRLTPVALDIETTGFELTEQVTVCGFSLPMGCRVFCYTGGQSAEQNILEESLEASFDVTINVTTHETESALLQAVTAFSEESLRPREYMLVAYNGEVHRGGFDLPFLRTRYVQSGVDWPFDDLPYADLMPIFQNRFNTQSDGTDRNDLEGVYETLIGGGLTEKDPFETSESAVTAFEDGRFESLLAHNISDILRTDKLAKLAQQFCAKSEFQLKSLTPTSRDPSLGSGPPR